MFCLGILISATIQSVVASDVPSRLLHVPPSAETALATVNGVTIRAGDVEPLLWEWRGRDALQDLISFQIARSAAAKADVAVTEGEVQSRLDEVIQQLSKQLPPGKTLGDVFAEEGSAPSRLFVRIHTEMLLDKIVLKEFVPSDYIKISTIIVRLKDGSADSLKEGLRKADLAYAEATTGKGWDQAVNRFSDDGDAPKSKGLIGWRHWDAFPQFARKQLNSLPVGGVSKPIQTENGLQIFRVEEKGGAAPPTAIAELKNVYVTGARAKLVNKLRAEAKVVRNWQ